MHIAKHTDFGVRPSSAQIPACHSLATERRTNYLTLLMNKEGAHGLLPISETIHKGSDFSSEEDSGSDHWLECFQLQRMIIQLKVI